MPGRDKPGHDERERKLRIPPATLPGRVSETEEACRALMCCAAANQGRCALDLNLCIEEGLRPNPDTRRRAFFGHQSDTKTPEAGWASGVLGK